MRDAMLPFLNFSSKKFRRSIFGYGICLPGFSFGLVCGQRCFFLPLQTIVQCIKVKKKYSGKDTFFFLQSRRSTCLVGGGEMHKKERIDLILERIWPCPLSHAKMPNAVNTTYNALLMLGVDCQEERIWSTKQCVTSRNPSAH